MRSAWFETREKTIKEAGLTLTSLKDNLIDVLWQDKPAESNERVSKTLCRANTAQIFVHAEKYAGESARKKIERLAEKVSAKEPHHVVISVLEDIACTATLGRP